MRVVDMYIIKPFDQKAVEKAMEETGDLIVWEDHLMIGGLASNIADYFADSGIKPKSFKRFDIPQVYAGFGSGEELQKKYHYHKQDVADYIRALKG